MTSLHQPNSLVAVCGDLSRTGRAKPLGELGFALPMLGAARREQFSRKGAGCVMPVQNYSRRFQMAPGSHFTGTARVIACRQVSRVSSEGIQSNLPFSSRFRFRNLGEGTTACPTTDVSNATQSMLRTP